MIGLTALLSRWLVWTIGFPIQLTDDISYWEAIWLPVKLGVFGYLFFVGPNSVYI
jgi:hypothetical protein